MKKTNNNKLMESICNVELNCMVGPNKSRFPVMGFCYGGSLRFSLRVKRNEFKTIMINNKKMLYWKKLTYILVINNE